MPCCEGLFKAIFFMCSQSVIHSLNDEQYILKNRRFIESNTFYHNILQAVAQGLAHNPEILGIESIRILPGAHGGPVEEIKLSCSCLKSCPSGSTEGTTEPSKENICVWSSCLKIQGTWRKL